MTPKLSLKAKINLVFIIMASIFGVLIYSTYSSAKAIQENRHIIYQTGNINTILEKVLTSTINIETGTRGYAITGHDTYLEVYNDGRADVNLWMDSLRSMNNTNPDQLKTLDTIEKLISSKKLISEHIITTRRNEGLLEASKVIETGRSKEIMDSIRSIISDFQKKQIEILSVKLAETDQKVKQRNFYFLLFISIIVIIFLVSYIIVRRTAKQLLRNDELQNELIGELSIQNTQMSDFAMITTHNLRSPAANISSLISAIDDESNIDDYKMIFDMLKKVSLNLNETLNHLLEILHIKKNKTIGKEKLLFDDICSRTIESLQGEILLSKAEIRCDFSQVPEIYYPRIYLESIFHNLISNALKYRDPERQPEISIRTEIADSRIRLSVRDNGLGIDLIKYGGKIFGMNKVFHNHPQAKGVGLFITKTQVESMGGKITVSSEAGSGTVFTVCF